MLATIATHDDDRWQTVLDRDASGSFVFAVKTTGIYCRPSCPSRRPKRENVRFFDDSRAAERAGYRPCKRCRPRDASPQQQHERVVAQACQLLECATSRVSLAALAQAVGLSPSHLQRLFKAQLGVTPKAYAAALQASRVRRELHAENSITAAAGAAGFQSSGRFYSHTNSTLGMTPTSFRNGGRGTTIHFAVGECWLGSILVAATERGICAISLGDDPDVLVRELQDRFASAELLGGDHQFEQLVAQVVAFVERPTAASGLPLDLQGTALQLRVWQALTKIPPGQTLTYQELARRLGQPRAVRAVASSCAANPIAVAIPCHRVVRTDGTLAGYRWGIDRKAALLERERRDR